MGARQSVIVCVVAAGAIAVCPALKQMPPATASTVPSAAQGTTAPPQTPGSLQTIAPTRVLDTRIGLGARRAPVGTGQSVSVQLAGVADVPASGVSAVVTTVTVTQPKAAGFITASAAGIPRPATSTINFDPGQTVSNMAILPLGSNGAVTLFNGSAGSTSLILDVTAYYLDGTRTDFGSYVPVTPQRILDTRTGNGAPRAAVAAGQTISVWVAGRGGVQRDGADTAMLNVTATGAGADGYLTVWPSLTPRPRVSNVSFAGGHTTAALVETAIGQNLLVNIFNGSSRPVQIVADVSGYTRTYNYEEHSGLFTPIVPARVVDTRSGLGSPAVPLRAGGTTTVPVVGRAEILHARVRAAMVAVTLTQQATSGFLTAYPDMSPRPGTSNVNFGAHRTTTNLVAAPVGADGSIALFNGSTGSVQVIVDLLGYFADEGAAAGRVTDTSGNPVIGATVTLTADDFAGGSRALTGSDGRWEITGLTGAYSICVDATRASGITSAVGYVSPCSKLGWPIEPGDVSSGHDYQLTPAGMIHGRVVDSAGNPLGAVTMSFGGGTATAVTQPDGTYEIRGIAPAVGPLCADGSSATGTAVTSGYVPVCLTAQTGGAVSVSAGIDTTVPDIQLAAGGALTGLVTYPSGDPVSGLPVFACNQAVCGRAMTDPDGNYRIGGLPAGSFTIRFSPYQAASGWRTLYSMQLYGAPTLDATPTPVDVVLGATVSGIDDRLVLAGGVAGRVTGSDGAPIAGALVSITRTGSSNRVTTLSDGTYRATDVNVANDYTVCFSAAAHTPICYNQAPDSSTATHVAVGSGATTTGIDAVLP